MQNTHSSVSLCADCWPVQPGRVHFSFHTSSHRSQLTAASHKHRLHCRLLSCEAQCHSSAPNPVQPRHAADMLLEHIDKADRSNICLVCLQVDVAGEVCGRGRRFGSTVGRIYPLQRGGAGKRGSALGWRRRAAPRYRLSGAPCRRRKRSHRRVCWRCVTARARSSSRPPDRRCSPDSMRRSVVEWGAAPPAWTRSSLRPLEPAGHVGVCALLSGSMRR